MVSELLQLLCIVHISVEFVIACASLHKVSKESLSMLALFMVITLQGELLFCRVS